MAFQPFSQVTFQHARRPLFEKGEPVPAAGWRADFPKAISLQYSLSCDNFFYL
jgi:hypothetical protein